MFNLETALKEIDLRPEFHAHIWENNLVSINYTNVKPKTFSTEILKNLRGTVFSPSGEMISLPLHKFFNLNERPEITLTNSKTIIVKHYTKIDGSLVHCFQFDNQLFVSTKWDNTTPQAIAAKQIIDQDTSLRETIITEIELGYTPIFEYVGPENEYQIIKYNKERFLVYLCSRNIKTGEYTWNNNYPTRVDPQYDTVQSIYNICNENTSDETGEGFVCITPSNKWFKLKTLFYLHQQKIHQKIFSYKSAYKIVLKGEIDSIIDNIDDTECKIRLSIVKEDAQKDYKELSDKLKAAHDKLLYMSMSCRKNYAILARENYNEYFPLLMLLFDNKLTKLHQAINKSLIKKT